MTNVRGMTLKQFNDTLEEMRTIYPFKDETTRLGELRDLNSDSLRQVEIVTTDEETGIQIIMSKGVYNAGRND